MWIKGRIGTEPRDGPPATVPWNVHAPRCDRSRRQLRAPISLAIAGTLQTVL
jgi:hypothetical protein